jgi:predicted glycoside hydrolase/deacetylase ChbG (UPF0249 family)
LIENVPDGVTELCCHPGYADGLRDWYRTERAQEVQALCDPRVRHAVEREDLRLCTFTDVAGQLAARSAP